MPEPPTFARLVSKCPLCNAGANARWPATEPCVLQPSCCQTFPADSRGARSEHSVETLRTHTQPAACLQCGTVGVGSLGTSQTASTEAQTKGAHLHTGHA